MLFRSINPCDAWVSDNARVYGNAWVYDDAWVYDNARVYGDARVYGNARVSGNAWVCGDAKVYGDESLLWVSKIGSRHGTTTFFRTKIGISVTCGCFHGTVEDFEKKVRETHGENEHAQAYMLAINLAKLRIKID